MKIFYGSSFIEQERLEESGSNRSIKLDYYKILDNKNYGVSIVKTEYIPNSKKIETKDVKCLTKDEEKIEKLLELFRKFEVTPITVEHIIEDLKLKYSLYDF